MTNRRLSFPWSPSSQRTIPFISPTLTELELFPLTSQIARIVGDLRRAHAGLKAFDSGIAATALLTHSHLITRNVRDFQDIDGLSLMAL